MDKMQIVNYIEIKGETLEMDMLGPEEKKENCRVTPGEVYDIGWVPEEIRLKRRKR